MTDPDAGTFDDFEDDGPDDSAALDRYADELTEAVAEFGVQVLEPGFEAG